MSAALPKTAESLLAEGTVLYESGNVYQALERWREVLSINPEEGNARRYIEFVEGHFNISARSTARQVEEAQDHVSRLLGGDADKSETPQAPVGEAQYASARAPMAEVSVISSGVAEDVTAPPVKVMAEASPVAQKALIGPSGPKTQAEGLSIQSLSRQLADLHRAGKYEQAVQTAQQLLDTDAQHVVARRYIEEYRRQKQAALARQKLVQKAESAGASVPQPPQRPRSAPSQSTTKVNHNSDSPTVAPPPPPPESILSSLGDHPRVLIAPDQISWQSFDHRAGFFLSQVDGGTSYEDLIEISGMTRAEAIKILAQLVEQGVIGV